MPDDFLNNVRCKCKTGCTKNQCGCRKQQLPCNENCMPCFDNNCTNLQKVDNITIPLDENDSEEDTDDDDYVYVNASIPQNTDYLFGGDESDEET